MGHIITEEEYKKGARFESKAHGALIVEGQEIAHTLQCPHCGSHFISFKGSGHRRSYCFLCGQEGKPAVCCGKKSCLPHVPFEKRLEIVEKVPGLSVDDVPQYLELHPEISVSVL